MKQIRYNVFETNSSSTHALVMFNHQDYLKFKEGKIILNDCCKPIEIGDLRLKEERDDHDWCPYGAVKVINGEEADDYYFTYDSLKHQTDLEEEQIKTPTGDIVHGISIYISEG